MVTTSTMEFSINLTGTMVLILYLTTLMFSMWGISKFMRPRTNYPMLGIALREGMVKPETEEKEEEEDESEEKEDEPSEDEKEEETTTPIPTQTE